MFLVARCWSDNFDTFMDWFFWETGGAFTGDFQLQILFPRLLTSEKIPNEKNRKDFSSHCWDFVGIFDFCFGFFGLLFRTDSNLNQSVFFGGIHGEGPIAPSCCVGDGRETSPQNAISVEEFARCFGHFCGNVRVAPLVMNPFRSSGLAL